MGLISLRGRSLYWLMKIACGISFMMYGYDAGVLGGFLLYKPFLDAMGNPTGNYVIPMIVASYDLAACVTAVIVVFFAFNIGRRGTVIMGNIAAIVGSILQASAYSVAQMTVGRLFTGFAIGAISSAVPSYLSETGVEIGDRGPANALNAILLIGGVPIAYWIDLGLVKGSLAGRQASWRIAIAFQSVFAIASGTTMYMLPDTPRWYYARNRWEEGDEVLARLYHAPVASDKVQRTRAEILRAIDSELEANASLSFKSFLTMGIVDKTKLKIVRRICMCFWLPFIREWMGSSLIAYYSTVILSTVADPSLVNVLAGVLNTFFALGCVPLYFTVERVGRRKVLLYGAMTMTCLITIFTVLVALDGGDSLRWGSVAIIFIFEFCFGYAWQGAVWLYCSEIAPLEYRHIGAAATAFGEWLMTFITVFAGPIGFDNIGWYLWLWVICGNIVAIIFVGLLCPETGNRTLEQVDYLFVGKGFAGLRNQSAFDMEVAEDAVSEKDELCGDKIEVVGKPG